MTLAGKYTYHGRRVLIAKLGLAMNHFRSYISCSEPPPRARIIILPTGFEVPQPVQLSLLLT